jgi:hypothetical protein
MWFDRIFLDDVLLYVTKHYFVVYCVVNQTKTCKKMNDKTTWCNKISYVVEFDFHILIVSCIFDLVLHSSLCTNICCRFFCFKSYFDMLCCILCMSMLVRGRHFTKWRYNFKILNDNIWLLIIDLLYGNRRTFAISK